MTPPQDPPPRGPKKSSCRAIFWPVLTLSIDRVKTEGFLGPQKSLILSLNKKGRKSIFFPQKKSDFPLSYLGLKSPEFFLRKIPAPEDPPAGFPAGGTSGGPQLRHASAEVPPQLKYTSAEAPQLRHTSAEVSQDIYRYPGFLRRVENPALFAGEAGAGPPKGVRWGVG